MTSYSLSLDHGRYWLRGDPFKIPSDISGLSLWLDASYIDGLADGDMVATWTDLSGNNRHAAQTTDGNKPLYKTNIINGLPVVRFDGSNDYMTCAGTNPLNGAAGATIVVVGKQSVAKAAGCAFISCHGSQFYTGPWTSSVNIYRTSLWNASAVRVNCDQGDYRPDVGVFVEYIMRYTGSNIQHFVNKSQVGSSVAQTGAIATSASSIMIGNILANVDLYSLNGDIAEILVYNRSLTDEELGLL